MKSMKSMNQKRRFPKKPGKLLLVLSMLLFLTNCAQRGADDTPHKKHLVFEDDFERDSLGENWLDKGGNYRIVDGELRAKGALNNPLWLTKKLPTNAEINFSARSASPAVDIKVEIYGDGKSKPTSNSYVATSYVIILGGWNNTKSIIARMDEHKSDRKIRRAPKGEPNKVYRFSIRRVRKRLTWLLDDKIFLEMNDAAPLKGPGHEHFAINNWKSEVFFDNIAIYEI